MAWMMWGMIWVLSIVEWNLKTFRNKNIHVKCNYLQILIKPAIFVSARQKMWVNYIYWLSVAFTLGKPLRTRFRKLYSSMNGNLVSTVKCKIQTQIQYLQEIKSFWIPKWFQPPMEVLSQVSCGWLTWTCKNDWYLFNKGPCTFDCQVCANEQHVRLPYQQRIRCRLLQVICSVVCLNVSQKGTIDISHKSQWKIQLINSKFLGMVCLGWCEPHCGNS